MLFSFLAIRMTLEYAYLLYSHKTYFDQHYIINDYQLLETVHFITCLTFLTTGNWYCGLFGLLQSWLSIASSILRLDGGTKIILVHRVSQTAMSIAHILLFFICGVGSVFFLVFNDLFIFGNFGRSFVSTLSIVTGEFELVNAS